jgi:hypothetical protein
VPKDSWLGEEVAYSQLLVQTFDNFDGYVCCGMHWIYPNIRSAPFADIDILEFSNILWKGLVKQTVQQSKRLATISGSDMDNNNILERICDKEGNMCFTITDNQAK